MRLIAAVDENWGIGLKNQLLVHIPADQKYFRSVTAGKVVVMGRRTLESFPAGKPLKDRVNIVLSANTNFAPEGCVIVRSMDELLKKLSEYDSDSVYVIGGSKVYSEMLPYCSEALITKIDKAFDADAFFPDLDKDPDWELVRNGMEDEEQTYFDLIYHFLTYRRTGGTSGQD